MYYFGHWRKCSDVRIIMQNISILLLKEDSALNKQVGEQRNVGIILILTQFIFSISKLSDKQLRKCKTVERMMKNT